MDVSWNKLEYEYGYTYVDDHGGWIDEAMTLTIQSSGGENRIDLDSWQHGKLTLHLPAMALTDAMKQVLSWLSDFFYHRSALDPEIEEMLMPLNSVDWQNFYDHAVCDLIGED